MKGLLFFILFACSILQSSAIEITRVEPAFWWTGMKNTELQILIYGRDIAKSKVSLSYPGVKVKEIVAAENPNYLFIYLDISSKAKPGTFNIVFTESSQKYNHTYTLRARENAGGAAGFSQADVMYLIMPDRFANGNPANDSLEGVQANRLQNGARHGGDIAGIVKNLDYIADLGVTTVWFNPIQENKMPNGSYHGYAITDFYKVDTRFGSNEDYKDMIKQVHSKGMKVVMDMIFNHCGSSHWWMKDLPSKDWINSQEKYVQTNHYKWTMMDVHAPKSEKDVLINGWFVRSMPDLNQRNRHMARYLIQNSIWWIEYSRIDGIRQDTHPYADYDFMAQWCKEVEAQYPQFNIVGEAWYPRGTASAWWQRNSIINNKNTNLKTVMDFELTFKMQKAFDQESSSREGSEAGVFNLYEVIAQDFLFPDPANILTFLDNHDIARFMRADEQDLKRYKQALTFLLTTRGIPQIYYGTEILMSGSNRKDFPGGWAKDSANSFTSAGRTPMQNEAWNYLQKLLQWRKTNSPVTQGRLMHYTPDNSGVYVYSRYTNDQRVLVVLNGTNADKTITMERFQDAIGTNTFGKDVITRKNVDIKTSLSIPARGAYILELGK
jgi:glycosidase